MPRDGELLSVELAMMVEVEAQLCDHGPSTLLLAPFHGILGLADDVAGASLRQPKGSSKHDTEHDLDFGSWRRDGPPSAASGQQGAFKFGHGKHHDDHSDGHGHGGQWKRDRRDDGDYHSQHDHHERGSYAGSHHVRAVQ